MANLITEDPKKLVLASFSQTIAKTHIKNLRNFNIDDAYDNAIQTIFGYEGLQKYLEYGGLQNRSPAEVIISLVPYSSIWDNAKLYLDINNISIPKNKDIVHTLIKQLIKININSLADNIGALCPQTELWPPLYPNVNMFLSHLSNKQVDFGIISSGHEVFIRKVFEYYGMDQPLFCVTPDDKFELYGMDWKSKTKPSTYLIASAMQKWIASWSDDFKQRVQESGQDCMEYACHNAVYIGDDLKLDGYMANNAGIPFLLFYPDDSVQIHFEGEHRKFSLYSQLIDALDTGILFKL